MLEFNIKIDPLTKKQYLETPLTGKILLTLPQLNKGTAFSQEEREAFGLTGKLPYRVESLSEQVDRAYLQYQQYQTALQKNIYLNNLHDKNQILFYRLLSDHLEEMLPMIYTPIVGTAVKQFSKEYRQPRGLYITYKDQDQLDHIFQNRSNPNIDLIVITDGEGVLGIGDQGIGGMDIPVAKLMVYSLCGGIDPTRTLPIFLDVGTNNPELLADPLYLGVQHPRISSAEYHLFIEKIIRAIQRHFPHVFLHWEDLGRENARTILNTYENQLCTFNDDIQGTGAVTLAALLSACKITHVPLTKQRIIIFGAGSAGTGIADQLVEGMVAQGLSRKEAYTHFWLVDKQGLLLSGDPTLTAAQLPYARSEQPQLFSGHPLSSLIDLIQPTVLIGCSAQAGAFTQEIVEKMLSYCPRPIIFPLSNPNDRAEAHPKALIEWTQGQVLLATGSPFDPVVYHHQFIPITQCNNALIFPGIGLGILSAKAKRLTSSMLLSAAEALSHVPCHDEKQLVPLLLPPIQQARNTAKYIAQAVVETALKEHQTNLNAEEITINVWDPEYIPYRRPK